MLTIANAAAAIILAATAALLLAAELGAGSPEILRAAAVAVFAVGFFATRALPEFITALLVFLLCLAVGTPSDIVFSGFASGGFWLLFSGIISASRSSKPGSAGKSPNRCSAGST